MSSPEFTIDTSTDYSKFRTPFKTIEGLSAYYQLGRKAFARDLNEDPNNDSAFTMAVLTESEHVKDLMGRKSQWRNGWLDAYRNEFI